MACREVSILSPQVARILPEPCFGCRGSLILPWAWRAAVSRRGPGSSGRIQDTQMAEEPLFPIWPLEGA